MVEVFIFDLVPYRSSGIVGVDDAQAAGGGIGAPECCINGDAALVYVFSVKINFHYGLIHSKTPL